MQSMEAANILQLALQKEDDSIHEHTRISCVFVVTVAMYCVVSRHFCGSVPISMSKVELIVRSWMWPLIATGPGDIIESLSLLWP
jgi:hypothetical protein